MCCKGLVCGGHFGGSRAARQTGALGTQRAVCQTQEPTSQAPKSGGWLARMSGKPRAPAAPVKGSREGYQTHTDEIRRKYGDKLV